MPKHLYLIKEGEISLKGLNRGLFEKRLKNNIKDKLRPYHSTTQRQKGRIFLFVDEECPRERIEKALSTTFGIVGWAEAVMCEKRLETILEKAKELLKNTDTKTYEIARSVGFSDPNYFSFTFRRNVGISPSQYRAQARS